MAARPGLVFSLVRDPGFVVGVSRWPIGEHIRPTKADHAQYDVIPSGVPSSPVPETFGQRATGLTDVGLSGQDHERLRRLKSSSALRRCEPTPHH